MRLLSVERCRIWNYSIQYPFFYSECKSLQGTVNYCGYRTSSPVCSRPFLSEEQARTIRLKVEMHSPVETATLFPPHMPRKSGHALCCCSPPPPSPSLRLIQPVTPKPAADFRTVSRTAHFASPAASGVRCRHPLPPPTSCSPAFPLSWNLEFTFECIASEFVSHGSRVARLVPSGPPVGLFLLGSGRLPILPILTVLASLMRFHDYRPLVLKA